MKKKLYFDVALKEGISLGINNFLSIFLTLLLFVVTCWIPYLNIGTTIGMSRMILKLCNGEKIDPTAIFDKENFSQIGDFFLLEGFIFIGSIIGFVFAIIPMVVINIAWGFALVVLIDKKGTANMAIKESYDITFGNKWMIFAIELVVFIVIGVGSSLFSLIPFVGSVLGIIFSLLVYVVFIGLQAYIYRVLSGRCECEKPAAPAPAEPKAEEAPAADEAKKE